MKNAHTFYIIFSVFILVLGNNFNLSGVFSRYNNLKHAISCVCDACIHLSESIGSRFTSGHGYSPVYWSNT